MRDKLGRFVKGYPSEVPTPKGVHRSPSTEFKKGYVADDKHPMWKETGAGYTAIHQWIHRKLGMPKICNKCGDTKAIRYEWANISGSYKRDVSDYIRLCAKCHHKLDNIAKKGWLTRRKNG